MRRGFLPLWLSLFLVDNLAFGQEFAPTGEIHYVTGPDSYVLKFINNATDLKKTVYDKMINTFFFSVYPNLVNRFNPNSPNDVTFFTSPSDGVAYTANDRVTYNSNWFKDHPEDTDVVTHELMHVVQAYNFGGVPGWLTEGIADYARYKYGLNNDAGGWALPSYDPSQKYTDAYRVTARFLVWLETKKGYADIVDRLNRACYDKTYSAQTWNDITGKSVDDLWNEYAQNPSITAKCANTASADPNCEYWKSQGFCATTSVYYAFMKDNCAKSCVFCSCTNTAGDPSCESWKSQGFCATTSVYYAYMSGNCAKSCEFC